MALDKDGRPIPVEIPPPPPDYWAETNAEQQQFNIVAQKTDAVLMQVADHGQRISALELTGGEQLEAKLVEFTRRFDELMLAKMQDMEHRYEALQMSVSTAMSTPRDDPTPPVDLEPTPTPRRR